MPDTKTTVEMGLLFFEYRYDSNHSYDYVERDGNVKLYTFDNGIKYMKELHSVLTPISVREEIVEMEYYIEEGEQEQEKENEEEFQRLYS